MPESDQRPNIIGTPPRRIWRLALLRPYGGISVWHEHHGTGRRLRLLIVSRRELRIDWDHLREIASGR